MQNIAVNKMNVARLHIAVGVIFNDERDKVLLAERPADVHQGGLWEFPGGKCKKGEDIVTALKRELYEEVNLVVKECKSLLVINHDYLDKKVKLDVWTVHDWNGEVCGKEGQQIEWVSIPALSNRQFPEANLGIIEAISSI